MLRFHLIMLGMRTAAVLAVLFFCLEAGVMAQGPADNRVRDVPIPHDSGQSVTPSFEGWFENSDGTYTLSWGYFNRNYEETPDIPVGPGNVFSPGNSDVGQPTHFRPRRQTGVFTVVVPPDFGDRTLTWTLESGGQAISIPGHLRPEWMIDAMMEAPSRNTPPLVRFSEDGTFGQGPTGVRGSMVAKFPEAEIVVWVSDDMVKKMRDQQREPAEEESNAQLGVVWSKYRGPGTVTFSEVEPQINTSGQAVTSATFSEPGEYVLRALVWDDTGPQRFVMAVGFQCCWTNGYLTVVVE